MRGNVVNFMIDNLVNALIRIYLQYESEKIERKLKKQGKAILPKYITKRRIQIYNNGKIVFDSKDFDEIPENIQYTIKSYGIPQNIKPNNKTPLVYRINTTLSSMFPSEEAERECVNSVNKMIG